VRLKNAIHRTKTTIEQPTLDLITDEEHERRELHRDFYRRSEARMKKIDEIATKPTITMAIQGMWVAANELRQPLSLQFERCTDEHDSLALFQYRDPRMLVELVKRRMVEDVSAYLDRYTASRVEPPSFLLTPEELPSYVHLPAGNRVSSLTSLAMGTFAKGLVKGRVAGETESSVVRDDRETSLVRLAKVPRIEKALEEKEIVPLGHLASSTPRSFELIYSEGRTDIALSARSAENLREYVDQLDAVYGELAFEKLAPVPPFLRSLPAIVGVSAAGRLSASNSLPAR
jgi:hypothetical protein